MLHSYRLSPPPPSTGCLAARQPAARRAAGHICGRLLLGSGAGLPGGAHELALAGTAGLFQHVRCRVRVGVRSGLLAWCCKRLMQQCAVRSRRFMRCHRIVCPPLCCSWYASRLPAPLLPHQLNHGHAFHPSTLPCLGRLVPSAAARARRGGNMLRLCTGACRPAHLRAGALYRSAVL